MKFVRPTEGLTSSEMVQFLVGICNSCLDEPLCRAPSESILRDSAQCVYSLGQRYEIGYSWVQREAAGRKT